MKQLTCQLHTKIPMLQNITTSAWQPYYYIQAVPAETRRWLFNASSMTQQLLQVDRGMQVKILQQGWQNLSLIEKMALRTFSFTQYAFIREVALYCQGQVWMYGRTVIPVTTLTGKERRLLQLGTNPIGKILYRDPTMRRSKFEIALLKSNENLWSRRSLFYISDKPLLLTEVFMPIMVNHFNHNFPVFR